MKPYSKEKLKAMCLKLETATQEQLKQIISCLEKMPKKEFVYKFSEVNNDRI